MCAKKGGHNVIDGAARGRELKHITYSMTAREKQGINTTAEGAGGIVQRGEIEMGIEKMEGQSTYRSTNNLNM